MHVYKQWPLRTEPCYHRYDDSDGFYGGHNDGSYRDDEGSGCTMISMMIMMMSMMMEVARNTMS